MKPGDPLLVDSEKMHKNLFVYDVIYNPQETKLIKAAKEKGLKCANGIGMLLYQGVMAFEHWTKQKAPVEVMRQALKKQIK
jgi:shikimate dehydrogenase